MVTDTLHDLEDVTAELRDLDISLESLMQVDDIITYGSEYETVRGAVDHVTTVLASEGTLSLEAGFFKSIGNGIMDVLSAIYNGIKNTIIRIWKFFAGFFGYGDDDDGKKDKKKKKRAETKEKAKEQAEESAKEADPAKIEGEIKRYHLMMIKRMADDGDDSARVIYDLITASNIKILPEDMVKAPLANTYMKATREATDGINFIANYMNAIKLRVEVLSGRIADFVDYESEIDDLSRTIFDSYFNAMFEKIKIVAEAGKSERFAVHWSTLAIQATDKSVKAMTKFKENNSGPDKFLDPESYYVRLVPVAVNNKYVTSSFVAKAGGIARKLARMVAQYPKITIKPVWDDNLTVTEVHLNDAYPEDLIAEISTELMDALTVVKDKFEGKAPRNTAKEAHDEAFTNHDIEDAWIKSSGKGHKMETGKQIEGLLRLGSNQASTNMMLYSNYMRELTFLMKCIGRVTKTVEGVEDELTTVFNELSDTFDKYKRG